MQLNLLYLYIIRKEKCSMNVVENEIIKKLNYINEKEYQQLKKKMNKSNDYFNFKEIVELSEKLSKEI